MARRVTTPWPEGGGAGTHHRIRTSALNRAWGEFLGCVRWQYAVALTFDPRRVFPISERLAEREALWWCNHLARISRRPVAWVVAPERGRSGQWHAHVLLVGLSSRSVLVAALAAWRTRNGRCHRQEIYAASGAVLYTTKEACAAGSVCVSDNIKQYRGDVSTEATVALFRDRTEH